MRRPIFDAMRLGICSQPLRALFLWALLFSLTGCSDNPYTYKAHSVPESIQKICKEEYKLDVQVRVVGKTVGVLLEAENLLEAGGEAGESVQEKMGRILIAATRVSLSTHLPIDFCYVVMRDRTLGEELSIIRSIDDVRRSNASALGIEESWNRVVLNHQKMKIKTDEFVVKDIKLPDFLAEQISTRIQRAQFDYLRENNENLKNPLILSEGHYQKVGSRRIFRFSFFALKSDGPKETILRIFKIVSRVMNGYSFKEYDDIEIQDYLNRQKLVVPRQALLDYDAKKINDETLLAEFLEESASIQEAFKLFSFDSSTGAPNPAPSTPATS